MQRLHLDKLYQWTVKQTYLNGEDMCIGCGTVGRAVTYNLVVVCYI